MFWTLLLTLATVLLCAEAQRTLPIWITKELMLLKSDAEANVKGAQFILDRIENSIIRSEHSSNEFGDRYRLPIKASGMSSYPRDCKEALKRDDGRDSLWRMIDPDGNRGSVEPFMVRCERRGSAIVTEFGFLETYWVKKFSGPHSCYNQKEFGVPGMAHYCTKTKTKIDYVLTAHQMRAAVHVSGNCSQRFEWSCHANSLLYLSAQGTKMRAYGRSLHDFQHFAQGMCECGKDSSCSQPHMLCNCGSDRAEKWQRDVIQIEDNNSLPVTELLLGDMAGRRDKAQVYVSNVVCQA